MMKSGASKLDQNAIRKFAEEEGKDAVWISSKMQIPLKCVEGFMPNKVEELSPQQRGANTRKANAAAAEKTDERHAIAEDAGKTLAA